MKTVLLGAPNAGKSTLAARLGLPDRFGGAESLADLVYECRGADLALIVFDVRVPAQVQASRSEIVVRQAGIGRAIAVANKMDLVGYEYESFKAARAVFLRGWAGTPPAFVPVSARLGDMLELPGDRIDWHYGPTLSALLGLREKVAA
jgi:sulfate adenylyltransferase subunit 1 (EFTu-like GTPase family)